MERLITLLCEHWTPDEFHRIVVAHGGFGAGEGLRHDLLSPKDARPSQFYCEIVALLRRHKAINRRFFAALRRSRPHVESDVRRLEASLRARRRGRSGRDRQVRIAATIGVMLAALVSIALHSCSPADAPPANYCLSKSMLAELMQ